MILGTIAAVATSGGAQQVIAMATLNASTPTAFYPWDKAFGARFAQPATVPTNACAPAFSADGTTVVLTSNASATPYVFAYPWSATGFGTKYADPGTSPGGDTFAVDWNGSSVVGFAGTASPYIFAYNWSSGWGSKFANPATLPAGPAYGFDFNPAGTYVAAAHETSPFITVYPWSSGFGTKVANPASLPVYVGSATAVKWRTNGDALASVGVSSTGNVYYYPFTTSFGTLYTQPATKPPGTSYGVNWDDDGTNTAIAHNSIPAVSAYPWSSGFGTKYANPATIPAGNGRGVVWSTDGTDIFVASSTTPFIQAYPWSSGFGTKYANPSTLPAAGAAEYGVLDYK